MNRAEIRSLEREQRDAVEQRRASGAAAIQRLRDRSEASRDNLSGWQRAFEQGR
jgi:hypothetical protein